MKIILYYCCRNVPVETIKALAQDHRNDVLSNCVALLSGLIGERFFGKFTERFDIRFFLAGQAVLRKIDLRLITIDPSKKIQFVFCCYAQSDLVGAVIISFYIIVSWVRQATRKLCKEFFHLEK